MSTSMDADGCTVKPQWLEIGTQKIMWLGVAGLLIVTENRGEIEILLVDPWPSYKKRGGSSTKRDSGVAKLCRWLGDLFKAHQKCRISGIIVTHEHYDHAADIVPLLRGLLPVQKAIPIIADKGTICALKSQLNEDEKRRSFFNPIELKWNDGAASTSIYHSDGVHKLCPEHKETPPCRYGLIPGTKLALTNPDEVFKSGCTFEFFVWDHSNTFEAASVGNLSGNLQRSTAFQMTTPNGKKVFFIGSAGEMNLQFCGPVQAWSAPKEVDYLFQAIPLSPILADKKRQAVAQCHASRFRVKEATVAIHFEHFVAGSLNRKCGDLEKKRNMKNLIEYEKELNSLKTAAIGALGLISFPRCFIEYEPRL